MSGISGIYHLILWAGGFTSGKDRILNLIGLRGTPKSLLLCCFVAVSLHIFTNSGAAAGVQTDSQAAVSNLVDEEYVRNATVSEMMQHVSAVALGADDDSKDAIRQVFEDVHIGNPGKAAELSFDELVKLHKYYKYLSRTAPGQHNLIASWIDESPLAETLGPDEAIWLLTQFNQADVSAHSRQVQRCTSTALKYLHDGAVADTDLSMLAECVRAIGPHLSSTERGDLARLVSHRWESEFKIKQAFNLSDAREVDALVKWQGIFDSLSADDAGPSEYARLLPAYLDKMSRPEPFWGDRTKQMRLIAQPINSPGLRGILQDQLFNESGKLRQRVSLVLAYSYISSGLDKEWDRFLGQALEDTSNTPDQAAQWMIASYLFNMIDPNNCCGGGQGIRAQLVMDAYSIAETLDIKTICLEHIVLAHLDSHRFGEARSRLEGHRTEFEGETSDALDILEEIIDAYEVLVTNEARSNYGL